MIRVTEISNKEAVKREIYRIQRLHKLETTCATAVVKILQQSWPVREKYAQYMESVFESGCDEKKLLDVALKRIMKDAGVYDYDVYESLRKRFSISNQDTILNNPYYNKIMIKGEKTLGQFSLRTGHYDRWEIVMEDSVSEDYWFPQLALNMQYIEYPEVTQGGGTWMSITQNEINTMREALDNAHGRVLVLGMGLCYYPYMISLKDNVESITIVEISQNCINLCEEYILPKFEHRDKIRVIKGDALAYIESLKGGEYDYCFADIISSANDIDLYTINQQLLNNVPNLEYDIWMENAMADGYLREVQAILTNDGLSQSDMVIAMQLASPLRAQIPDDYISTMPSIDTPEQLRKLLDMRNIKEFMRSTNYMSDKDYI